MATARAAPKRQPEIDEKKESVRRSLSFTHTRQGKCVLTAAKVVAGVLVKGVPPSASLALGRTQPRGDNINPRVLHKKWKGHATSGVSFRLLRPSSSPYTPRRTTTPPACSSAQRSSSGTTRSCTTDCRTRSSIAGTGQDQQELSISKHDRERTHLAKAGTLAQAVGRQVLAVASVLPFSNLLLFVDPLPLLGVCPAVRSGTRVGRDLGHVLSLSLRGLLLLERLLLSLLLLLDLETLLLLLEMLLLLLLQVSDVLVRERSLGEDVREARGAGLAVGRGRERGAGGVGIWRVGVLAVVGRGGVHLGGEERDLDWGSWRRDLAFCDKQQPVSGGSQRNQRPGKRDEGLTVVAPRCAVPVPRRSHPGCSRRSAHPV